MVDFQYSVKPVLEPRVGCSWADQMVLNPAFIPDPKSTRLHMLFRASGPWPQKQRAGQPLPYPIFLGYAYSDDNGKSWVPDFSHPALAPALEEKLEKICITMPDGQKRVNHANGCVEDPRLFWLEGTLYLTCACRMFPPGPYWENTPLDCCSPSWATEGKHPLGRAATENVTVTVLYKVDLDALKNHHYEKAFTYITHLSDPERGDNRDVFPFPEKIRVLGKMQYACLHRPWVPADYAEGLALKIPCIFVAAADELTAMPTTPHQHVLASPKFDWESDRIGASWPPIKLENGQWLLAYHGKQSKGNVGYTQSFMIVQETENGWPVVTHRCPERLMFAQRPWELDGMFPTPCLFTCAGCVIGDELVMTYGAADTKAGVARVNFNELVRHVRMFDGDGKPLMHK